MGVATKREREALALANDLCQHVPATMTDMGYNRDTCILSTRVALEVARELGVRARALACQVIVANAVVREMMDELGDLPSADEYVDRGGWALGIGFGADSRRERPGWDGHLVAVLESTIIVDLTLDQANRPEKNILLRPAFSTVPSSFLAGHGTACFTVNGSWVSYSAMPTDRTFTLAPDWTHRHRHNDRSDPTPRVLQAITEEAVA